MTTEIRSSNILRPEDVHHALIELLLAGGGLNEVVRALAGYVNRPVVIADKAGLPMAGELSPAARTGLDTLARELTGGKDCPLSALQARAWQVELYLVPLIIQDKLEGLLVAEANEGLDTITKETLEQGSTAAALALLQHQAVHAAEQRLQRDVLEDLLTAESRSGKQLAEEARALGWEFEAKPVVILLDFSQARHYSLAERGADQAQLHRLQEQFSAIIGQTLAEHCPQSIIARRNHGLIILPHLPTGGRQAGERARVLVDDIAKQIDVAGLKIGYYIAAGGFHQGIDGLRASFREAQQALEIGMRLRMRRPIWFDEVQLYLLLERSSRSEDVQDWLNRTLGRLLDYDRRNNTQMVQTLEVYFDANQRLQDAARALHVHPNTLKYRLGRIEQILGQEPFESENQIRFYLATKMARLL